MVARDGSIAVCPRTESERLFGDGGYIHVLGDGDHERLLQIIAEAPKPEPRDFTGDMLDYEEELDGTDLRALSASLGVETIHLRELRVGWCQAWNAYTFPMRSGDGKVIGIRIRSLDGDKWAISGSRAGLFIPDWLRGEGPLLLCEGPTSTAAARQLGYEAIGRPSASGGAAFCRTYCRGRKRDVVIVADDDKPDKMGRCAGIAGAEALAKKLQGVTKSLKIIMPLKGKDIRDWLARGATKRTVDIVIGNADLWMEKHDEATD